MRQYRPKSNLRSIFNVHLYIYNSSFQFRPPRALFCVTWFDVQYGGTHANVTSCFNLTGDTCHKVKLVFETQFFDWHEYNTMYTYILCYFLLNSKSMQ